MDCLRFPRFHKDYGDSLDFLGNARIPCVCLVPYDSQEDLKLFNVLATPAFVCQICKFYFTS